MQRIKISNLTDDELIDEAEGLYWDIHVLDSFGTYDLMRYEVLVNELENRGYHEVMIVDFIKEEEEDD